jgi:hypothetical protein
MAKVELKWNSYKDESLGTLAKLPPQAGLARDAILPAMLGQYLAVGLVVIATVAYSRAAVLPWSTTLGRVLPSSTFAGVTAQRWINSQRASTLAWKKQGAPINNQQFP